MSDYAFPKPKDIKRDPVTVHVYRGGREVCNKMCKAGKLEYKFRVLAMLERQKGKCCLCGLPLSSSEATFEHQDGRGFNGSYRDDRIIKDGKPYNGAAHGHCNRLKGSRRINYNATP
ncbi:MAG TPA: hypothetical protein VN666_21750 [Nitrospira sp.]|nr:hypothetical protein [Nitrospira sp.]